MGIDFPSSLTASTGQKFTYSGQEYEFNGTAWRKVRDRVTSFNGATGAIIGVTSVQGKTGDVTLTDLEITHGVETFNGLSGSIEGVSSVNGNTGAVTNVAFQNAQNTFSQTNLITSGEGFGADGDAEQSIKFQDNFIVTIGDVDDAANSTKLTVDDNNQLVTVSPNLAVDTSIQHTGDTNTKIQFGTDTIDFDAGGREGMKLTATETQFNNGITVTGISGPSGITFSNGEAIRNSPDGSIQIIPSDEGGNHFGIEIDATEWGFGPVVNVIDESGTQVTKAIRLDTDVVMSHASVPDGTPATIFFNNGSDRGMAQNSNGDGTIGMGVNGSNGHFAVVSKFHLNSSNRSMSTSDKTALSMSNPQFLVYSADANDANDYLRIEHDQTDANIFSGNGGINLVPLNGAVGISGGGLNVGTNGITFGDDTTQKGAAKNVATFTIQASSAITTGSKTNAMYRMPYNATLLGLQGKITANGNIRGSIDIAGPDFGDPTTGHASAISFQHTSGGNTFDHTSIDQASVDAGDYLYVAVSNNASGATGAQFFVTYETR